MKIVHALIAQDAKGATTKCGKVVKKGEATAWWRTDATCPDCLDLIAKGM